MDIRGDLGEFESMVYVQGKYEVGEEGDFGFV